LEKRSLGTPEAIKQLCRIWRVDQKRIHYGGLKDRHAHTIQYLTIHHGPPREHLDKLISVKYLGQLEEPYGPQSFHSNYFTIVIRDICRDAYPRIMNELQSLEQTLIGNYFDDQRFGSVNSDQQYVARALIDGDEEKALKLALTSYYEHDRSREKKAKQWLRQNWGQWKVLVDKMPVGYLQSIARYLADHPDDFRKAFTLIPHFLKNMYLSAYQSYLWNRILHTWITSQFKQEKFGWIVQKYHRLAMPAFLDVTKRKQYLEMEIPLPCSRCEPFTGHFAEHAIQKVLFDEGLTMKDIQLKQFREPFFSKGMRRAFYQLQELSFHEGWDKLHKGNYKLTLKFTLPRGSYATIVIKRLTTWRLADEQQKDSDQLHN
jgi:tRNA pseudouridine13 synthase